MFGWFKKRPKVTPVLPSEPKDMRVWNEDWQVGDTAECICDFDDWDDAVKPWRRPKKGQRYIVLGFAEGVGSNGKVIEYYLCLEGMETGLSTRGFRKVRPDSRDQSEIVERILKATPGRDVVREPEAI